MNEKLYEMLEANPVIAAVKNIENYDIATSSNCDIIFLMCGNIFNLEKLVSVAKESGKIIFIHVDLIDGFSRDAVALEYICKTIKPHGIISTKSSQIKIAKYLGLLTVQRMFIVDSMSIETAIKSSTMLSPDAVEIMPGVMPKIIGKLSNQMKVPLIAGGLIKEKEDVINALNCGAMGVSTTAPEIWSV